jgi:hypothetical protein
MGVVTTFCLLLLGVHEASLCPPSERLAGGIRTLVEGWSKEWGIKELERVSAAAVTS